jgi:hypothetical protein
VKEIVISQIVKCMDRLKSHIECVDCECIVSVCAKSLSVVY